MSRPTARKPVAKGEYIETDSGNKVSRRAQISGTANIMLGGRTVISAHVHLRGDLHPNRPTIRTETLPTGETKKVTVVPTAIAIGRCTIISSYTVIKPPHRASRGMVLYYSMKIGDNVFVGEHCQISAISIGSHVNIGDGAVLGAFAIVKDFVKVLPGTVVPAHMVIPSGVVVGGRPARVVGEVGEGWGVGVQLAGSGTLGLGAAGGGELGVEGGDLREVVRGVR